MPSRHSKNNTSRGFFTHHERQTLDNWGTREQRLSKDSFKNFFDCGLCLQRAEEPLLCPKGHLYCKGCIYENLLAQRQFIRKQQSIYEEQKAAEEAAEEAKAHHPEQEKLLRFQEMADSIHSSSAGSQPEAEDAESGGSDRHSGYSANAEAKSGIVLFQKTETGLKRGPAPGYKTAIAASGREVYVVDEELVEQMNRSSSAGAAGDAPASAAVSDNSNFHQQQQEKQRILPSHWIPSQAPEAAPRKAEAPVRSTHCPMGHHSLRLKQLIPVQWDTVMEEEEGGKKKLEVEYRCSGRCGDTFSNQKKAFVLRKCGHAFCTVCVKKLVIPSLECPDCGKRCSKTVKKDVIEVHCKKSSFAAGGSKVVKKMLTPAFQG